MNSWQKPFHTLLMALAFLIFMLSVRASGEDHLRNNFFETYDGQFREQDLVKSDMAKDIASSTAAGLFVNTRTGKKLNRLRRSMTNRFKFEYKKEFNTPDNLASPLDSPPLRPGEKQLPLGISFSGKFDDDTKPVLELNTRLAPASISTQFNLLENELNCEISSQRLNTFTGVKSGINFNSNGSDTKAVFTIKFEF